MQMSWGLTCAATVQKAQELVWADFHVNVHACLKDKLRGGVAVELQSCFFVLRTHWWWAIVRLGVMVPATRRSCVRPTCR